MVCGWAHITYSQSKQKAIVRVAQTENPRGRLMKTIFCQQYLITSRLLWNISLEYLKACDRCELIHLLLQE